jgi:16S rRNA (cytosine1402-N4)-methyltransferase
MISEILDAFFLRPQSSRSNVCFVDGTLGLGGHTRAFLPKLHPPLKMILNDADEEALARTKNEILPHLNQYDVTFTHAFFDELFLSLPPASITWCLCDLGVSSYQLAAGARGFSFHHDGPLDMRLSASQSLTAADLIQIATLAELSEIFKNYGEEPRHQKLARAIFSARQKGQLPLTTKAFASWVAHVLNYKNSRRHPATRTFQALRIAVNQELARLQHALTRLPEILQKNSVFGVLTFHSLESKCVEKAFQKWENNRAGHWAKHKPSKQEVELNPRSRSACFYVFYWRGF